jgi:hypothetical protein
MSPSGEEQSHGNHAEAMHSSSGPQRLPGRVTLRIEKAPAPGRLLFRLIGRMQSEHLPDLKRFVEAPGSKPAFDLEEVTLVDVEAVRFLIGCEFAGIELLHCSPYIRHWMDREQLDPK